MNDSTSTIGRITSRGQVTVPASVRSEFDSDYVSITPMSGGIFVAPVQINSGPVRKTKKKEVWTSVWNAKHDNEGKGMPLNEFSKILDKVKKERGF